MHALKAKSIYLVIGIILLLIGSIIGIGWILLNPLLITFFTYQNPLGLISFLSIIFSGIFFCLKSTKYHPIIFRLKQASVICVILISTLAFILALCNISVYAYLFPEGEFVTYFLKNNSDHPHLLWLIAGGLLLKSTRPITYNQLSYLENLNFILLFFSIIGTILYFHEFTLIYTWMNKFSMPLAYGIALALVNIGMIVVWGKAGHSNNKYTQEVRWRH